MPLTTIQPTHKVSALTAILNGNFEYLLGLIGGGGGTGGKYVATLTDASGDAPITHNLSTVDIVVSCWDAAGRLVFADIQVTGVNTLVATFEESFTGRVVVRS